jgi:hypothetical protein
MPTGNASCAVNPSTWNCDPTSAHPLLPFRTLLLTVLGLYRAPFHDLEVEYKNGTNKSVIKGCHAEPADLREAQWLPKRPAVNREWKQRQNRGAHRDHHRTQALDSCIEQRMLERLALFEHFFDEVEAYNRVTDPSELHHGFCCEAFRKVIKQGREVATYGQFD